MVACQSRLFTLCGLCVRHLELDHTGTNHFHRLYVLLGGLDTCVRIGTLCRLFPLLFSFFLAVLGISLRGVVYIEIVVCTSGHSHIFIYLYIYICTE